MSVTCPVHPCAMLWSTLDTSITHLRSLCLNPMVTLSIWKKSLHYFSLSSPCTPLLNVLFNPEISDSLSYSRMYPWSQAGIFQLRNLVHPLTHRLYSFAELQHKFQIPKQLFYTYLQFKHYFSSKSSTITLEKHTPFELLCAQGPNQTHLILSIYQYLHNAHPLHNTSYSYMNKWSQILQRSITLPQWQKI